MDLMVLKCPPENWISIKCYGMEFSHGKLICWQGLLFFSTQKKKKRKHGYEPLCLCCGLCLVFCKIHFNANQPVFNSQDQIIVQTK